MIIYWNQAVEIIQMKSVEIFSIVLDEYSIKLQSFVACVLYYMLLKKCRSIFNEMPYALNK